MALDRRLYTELRRLDRHDLRRIAIFVRGLLVAMGDEFDAVGEREPGVTYRLEAVKCGKPGCSRCPHGPYWYAYYREDGKLRSRYIGRELPGEGAEAQAGAPGGQD
jgi:hypothetical protein